MNNATILGDFPGKRVIRCASGRKATLTVRTMGANFGHVGVLTFEDGTSQATRVVPFGMSSVAWDLGMSLGGAL